jgi:phage FluMu protein Com
MIALTCPHCGRTGQVPNQAAGKKVRCPRCKQLCFLGGSSPAAARALAPVTQATPAVSTVACPGCRRSVPLFAEDLHLPSVQCSRCDTVIWLGKPEDHLEVIPSREPVRSRRTTWITLATCLVIMALSLAVLALVLWWTVYRVAPTTLIVGAWRATDHRREIEFGKEDQVILTAAESGDSLSTRMRGKYHWLEKDQVELEFESGQTALSAIKAVRVYFPENDRMMTTATETGKTTEWRRIKR